MEEIRISARRTGDGEFEFDSYDAEMLFRRATERLNAKQCEDAIDLYDRLLVEFPSSRYVSPSLYNGALCLDALSRPADAAERFDRLVRTLPDSPDRTHALFQLSRLYVDLERFPEAAEAAGQLLSLKELDADERIEAMARRAQGLFGAGRIDEAADQARTALAYYRARVDGPDRIREVHFVAANNYVLAETVRARASRVSVPRADVAEQRAELERRAQLILDAQREYFNTIRHTDPHWAAASGYRIGSMYDDFWSAIMNAPVPPPRKTLKPAELPIYEEEYRKELARLVRPLIRHSIRYWELTLMMIERTGVQTEWSEKIRDDLERARQRLLEVPSEGTEERPTIRVPEDGRTG